MSRFDSPKKASFLSGIPTASIENLDCPLTKRSKFNFSYFEKQSASQNFDEWTPDQLGGLLEKLRDYSRESLSHWMTMPIGKSGTVLSIYGAFPSRSEMTHPKHVPHQAQWGRFRLDWAGRLCGFVVPRSVDGNEHPGTKLRFDANTFYVVFLDRDHRFYRGKEEK